MWTNVILSQRNLQELSISFRATVKVLRMAHQTPQHMPTTTNTHTALTASPHTPFICSSRKSLHKCDLHWASFQVTVWRSLTPSFPSHGPFPCWASSSLVPWFFQHFLSWIPPHLLLHELIYSLIFENPKWPFWLYSNGIKWVYHLPSTHSQGLLRRCHGVLDFLRWSLKNASASLDIQVNLLA